MGPVKRVSYCVFALALLFLLAIGLLLIFSHYTIEIDRRIRSITATRSRSDPEAVRRAWSKRVLIEEEMVDWLETIPYDAFAPIEISEDWLLIHKYQATYNPDDLEGQMNRSRSSYCYRVAKRVYEPCGHLAPVTPPLSQPKFLY